MQVAVDQSVFASALGAVVRAIPGHNSMPILSGVYVQAAGGQLVLRATDLGLGVEHRLAAEVEQEGVAVLPAACLAQLVRRLPDERVRLAVGGELAAELRCGRSRFRLQGMAPDQFPACFSPAQRWCISTLPGAVCWKCCGGRRSWRRGSMPGKI